MPVVAFVLAAAILSGSPQAATPAQASATSATTRPVGPAELPGLPTVSPALAEVLAKAAEYCRKLESSAFDFVCREEIREVIDPKYDAAKSVTQKITGQPGYLGPRYLGPSITISTVRKIKRSFVYDYQCIRAGRSIRESRTLLEENGKRKVRENAELQTSVVVYGTALLAPVGLFGARFQANYDFTVVGEERSGPTRLLLVDAKPKPGAPPSRDLYGRAWINPATGDIHRIEWSENRVGNFDVFEKRGEKYKRTPRLAIQSEFSAEKNGIRFPSRLEVEETYLNDKGKVFVRSRTEVVYKDFKFFTVEFEVRD